MAVPKYKKQFLSMVENNKELFDEYLEVQDKFDEDPKSNIEHLGEIKRKLMRVLRKNEDILCAKSERTTYAAYSTNLADKFWEEVRAEYPRIDEVDEI